MKNNQEFSVFKSLNFSLKEENSSFLDFSTSFLFLMRYKKRGTYSIKSINIEIAHERRPRVFVKNSFFIRSKDGHSRDIYEKSMINKVSFYKVVL